jgi:hypothetical protein
MLSVTEASTYVSRTAVVWACNRCNHEKRDLTVEEYRAVLTVRTGRVPVFWGETEAANAPDPIVTTGRRGVAGAEPPA